ncbi:MAG: hypothetical protein K0R26_2012 [Bacteroidota bacterium]|jgi:hypothetical protein|nr:hypothetical protein [Bacteroidota bacterium]
MLDNKYVKIELINGVLEAEYKPIYIDIKVAKDVLVSRNQFTKNKALPMLLNGIGIKGIDKEARDYFSEPQGSEGLTATAILVKSRLDTFFANFLLKVNLYKSNLPIKVFNNYEDALKWLENYK